MLSSNLLIIGHAWATWIYRNSRLIILAGICWSESSLLGELTMFDCYAQLCFLFPGKMVKESPAYYSEGRSMFWLLLHLPQGPAAHNNSHRHFLTEKAPVSSVNVLKPASSIGLRLLRLWGKSLHQTPLMMYWEYYTSIKCSGVCPFRRPIGQWLT